jgi:hypothetical protein
VGRLLSPFCSAVGQHCGPSSGGAIFLVFCESWPDPNIVDQKLCTRVACTVPARASVHAIVAHQPAQRSRIFPSSRSPFTAQDALMLGPRGYNVTFRQQGAPTCAPVLPGTLRPDWASRGPCTCEAVLTGKSALTPYGTSQIITCPLTPPRAAWAWYALDGRPTSFAVTSFPGDQGFGLFAVLDYRDWLPGHDIQHSVFDMPPQCRAPSATVRAELRKCSTCHVGAAGTTR